MEDSLKAGNVEYDGRERHCRLSGRARFVNLTGRALFIVRRGPALFLGLGVAYLRHFWVSVHSGFLVHERRAMPSHNIKKRLASGQTAYFHPLLV